MAKGLNKPKKAAPGNGSTVRELKHLKGASVSETVGKLMTGVLKVDSKGRGKNREDTEQFLDNFIADKENKMKPVLNLNQENRDHTLEMFKATPDNTSKEPMSCLRPCAGYPQQDFYQPASYRYHREMDRNANLKEKKAKLGEECKT